MMTPLDSTRLAGKQRPFDVRTIEIHLDINEEDMVDENIPLEEDDIVKSNPSVRINKITGKRLSIG
jgi:hypothetical protein